MKKRTLAFYFLVSGFLLFSVFTSNAAAEPPEINMTLSGGGGVFAPFKGNTGSTGILQFMFLKDDQMRVGGEIEYRDFEGEILDVDDVEIQSLFVRGLVKYYLKPAGVSPYIGAGFGVSFNTIDSKRVQQQRPGIIITSNTGQGIGVVALAGVEVPLSDPVSFFIEGRFIADFQMVELDTGPGDDDIEFENLGGVSALAGLLLRF